jgi:hypothetical protein
MFLANRETFFPVTPKGQISPVSQASSQSSSSNTLASRIGPVFMERLRRMISWSKTPWHFLELIFICAVATIISAGKIASEESMWLQPLLFNLLITCSFGNESDPEHRVFEAIRSRTTFWVYPPNFRSQQEAILQYSKLLFLACILSPHFFPRRRAIVLTIQGNP